MSEVRLQVKNLCKSFGITKAVQNVSFNVNKGEVHALIGENGSGKSTLTNMLTGIYSIGSGTFILDGKEIHPKNQVEANNEGVSIIVQELGTLSGLTVEENIFLGHEEQFVHFGIKNTNAMNRKATELLKKYGFDRIKASDIIDDYNFEDRKLVEIVKATYFDPKIVVVDETTTALSQEGREELYKHMDRIRNSGNSVIFISHDLPEVLEKSDTITILRDGVYIDTVKSKDVTEDDLKRLMVGREVTGDYYRADYGEKVSDEVVLSVKNVTVPGLIEDVSFELHKGEILGFGGLSESGMHEIGKAIFGASYDRTGTVQLADGTEYTATVVGQDSTSDVAVLKIEATGLTPAVIGDSDSLAVGETTIAVGNPLGTLSNTVTNGIVSALNREVTVQGNDMNLIQTSASISPGNSGGGLFNANGELIGIVNAKSSSSDAEGLGFAIPINTAMEMAKQMIEKGYVARPAMGVTVITINDAQTAMQYGVSNYGVYIYQIASGSGAEKGGLKLGDRIISIDDVAVSSASDVQKYCQSKEVGDTVTLQVERDGKVISCEVTLGESTQSTATAESGN